MRLFLAVEIPAPVREALAALQDQLRAASSGWRFTQPDSLHLTLRFLGETGSAAAAAVGDAAERACRASAGFSLRPVSLGLFPERGRPRVLWIGMDEVPPGTRLAQLAARLERAVVEAGFPAEGRRFQAHLTLARAARDGRAQPPPPQLAVGPVAPFEVRSVTLFESHLASAGARYTPRARFSLGGATGPEGA